MKINLRRMFPFAFYVGLAYVVVLARQVVELLQPSMEQGNHEIDIKSKIINLNLPN